MAGQFIYTMHKVGKFIPPNRDVIKDITLSFFPGAKIGVLGPNGAGKSTLLKIMAGIDTDYTGEAKLGEGYTVGMLEQEPELDPTKTVLENVMDGAGDAAAMLAEYDKVLAAWSDPDADYEKLGAKQADLEAKIEAAGAWDLQRTVEIAMDALRTPPGDWGVENLSGGEVRRVAMARLLLAKPDLLLHDALSRAALDPMIEVATDLGRSSAAIMTDVIDYHADVTSLPARTEAAGIKQLALYHVVPAPPNAVVERIFLRGLPDDVILTRDLHTFDLPAGSNEIRITGP